jgi:pyruvate/2-oxoglutarate dehydrogenase complex dihydrolipoamide dehydrogenase (E3) component
MRMKGIVYYNRYASMIDSHTILLSKGDGPEERVTADKIVIAVGGRPSFQDIPGSQECCISSDDIFSLEKSPGKTLVVGASYIALVRIFC